MKILLKIKAHTNVRIVEAREKFPQIEVRIRNVGIALGKG